jgi:hypothetical protein
MKAGPRQRTVCAHIVPPPENARSSTKHASEARRRGPNLDDYRLRRKVNTLPLVANENSVRPASDAIPRRSEKR